MSRSFVREPLIFLLLLASCLAIPTKFEVFSDGSVLQLNTTLHESVPYIKQISISPSSNVTLNITNISSNIAFNIVQIHSHLHPVTLSYDASYNKSVFGTDIGLYVKPNVRKITQLFLKNQEADSIKAMLVIMSYNHKAPIPGGCNMEFETKIAPYEKVITLDTMIVVDVQPASVPSINSTATMCQKNPVSLEMYQVYLPEQDRSAETYFLFIKKMLTVNDIKENGQQITSSVLSNPMRRIFNAYTGTGSIYVAVATYGADSAAYVPSLSYGCSPLADPESCQVLYDSYSKFLCACCFFIGLFSVFCGHRCHNLDVTIPVFFTGTVISYIAIGQSITLAWVIGLVVAVAYGIIQHCLAMVKVLFVLTLGLFFACVAYFRFPESFVLTQTDAIFWAVFVTVTVSVCVMKLLLFAFTRGVITCAIFGSLMIILPFDYWAGSTLKYIIINIVRRCTIADFKFAIIQPPVQSTDIILIVFWTLLAILRCLKVCFPVSICCPWSSSREETTPLMADSSEPSAPDASFLSSVSHSNRGYRPYREYRSYRPYRAYRHHSYTKTHWSPNM